MNTTETKEYIEPNGFLGTKGDWNTQRLHDLIDNDASIAYHVLIANCVLLSQSKELVKSLDSILRFIKESDLIYNLNDIDKEFGNELTSLTGTAYQVINKALNINQ